jgi:hypothetical protein
MIGNYMYDNNKNAEFLIGNNPEQYDSYWWDDAEPLWIATVRQVSLLDSAQRFHRAPGERHPGVVTETTNRHFHGQMFLRVFDCMQAKQLGGNLFEGCMCVRACVRPRAHM